MWYTITWRVSFMKQLWVTYCTDMPLHTMSLEYRWMQTMASCAQYYGVIISPDLHGLCPSHVSPVSLSVTCVSVWVEEHHRLPLHGRAGQRLRSSCGWHGTTVSVPHVCCLLFCCCCVQVTWTSILTCSCLVVVVYGLLLFTHWWE